MNAYKLTNDVDNYQLLQLDTLEIAEQLGREDSIRQIRKITSSSNERIIDIWGPLKSIFAPTRDTQAVKIPDISVWKGNGLAFSGRAHGYFKLMLEPYGEFLPVSIEGHTFHLFHITTEGKVDLRHSDHKKDIYGEPELVTSLSFDAGDIENKLLFKSEFEFYQSPFCNQKFKDLYEECRLEGILFMEDLANQNLR